MNRLEPLDGRMLAAILSDELHTPIRYRSGCLVSIQLRDHPENGYSLRPDRNLTYHPSLTQELLHGPHHSVHRLTKYCGTKGCVYHVEVI